MMWIKSFLCLYLLGLFLSRIRCSRFSFSTFGITAAGVEAGVAVGGLGLAAYNSFKGSGGSGKGGYPMVDIPNFQPDPNVAKVQDRLYGYGSDLLDGNPNAYYAPIGEVGGSEFENMLNNVIRDTTKATNEGAIARGMGHSGALDSAIATNVGNESATLRYNDFLRAMSGRQSLLTTGTQQVEQVGANALTNQSQTNNYALAKAKLQMGQNDSAVVAGQSQAANTSNFLDSVGTLSGTVADLVKGNPSTTTAPAPTATPSSFSNPGMYDPYMDQLIKTNASRGSGIL